MVKAYFMTIEIDLFEEVQTFLTNTSLLNEGQVKVLHMKQNTLRQKMLPKA